MSPQAEHSPLKSSLGEGGERSIFRFAPSPTGFLHIGNARLAVLNALYARSMKGQFFLRIDDTDKARVRPEYEDALREDLAWLGIPYEDSFRQSERLEAYREAAEQLKHSGYLYPCYETPEELALMRKSLLAQGLPPVYDRQRALMLSDADRARLKNEGRKPHWRFRLDKGKPVLSWHDQGRNDKVEFHTQSLSDPVLVRADGHTLYNLSSVVDDIALQITHIVRGEDHITNSAAQIRIFEALGNSSPCFAHYPLLLAGDGSKLSKRLGGMSLRELRIQQGLEGKTLFCWLACLGSGRAALGTDTEETLAARFDPSHYGRAAPRVDIRELNVLNQSVLQNIDWEQIRHRAPKNTTREVWEAIRSNLTRFDEAQEWGEIFLSARFYSVKPADRTWLAESVRCLPPPPWGEEAWAHYAREAQTQCKKSGRAFFMPVREALTGKKEGPELSRIFVLLGPDKVRQRLTGRPGGD